MICLNNTDTLEGGASVNAVVDYTVHGLVGTTFTQLARGQLSNTDPSVLYTAAAAISIVSITLVNTHTAAVTVNLYLDPANVGTPRRMIPKNLSLGVGYALVYDGQRFCVMNANGGIVQTYAAHAADHQDGGGDEINATGLTGRCDFVDRGDPGTYDFVLADFPVGGAWTDKDLSAIVPAGAKAVLLSVQIQDDAAGSVIEFRKNGNTNNAAISVVMTQVSTIWMFDDVIVPLDSNRIIEYLKSDLVLSGINVTVRGWFI